MPNRWNYWDGRRWNGVRQETPGYVTGRFQLIGWREFWYGKIGRLPFVSSPLAWLNCSVPGVRGRVHRLMTPPQSRKP